MAFVDYDKDEIDLTVTADNITLETKEDTTILEKATGSLAGLMSSFDKVRLDNLKLTDLGDVSENYTSDAYNGNVSIIRNGAAGEFTIGDSNSIAISKENLVINGFHELGNGFNWPSRNGELGSTFADASNPSESFSREDTHFGGGQSIYNGSQGRLNRLSPIIRVNPFQKYQMSVSAKHVRPAGASTVLQGSPATLATGSYLGIVPIDADGLSIASHHHMYSNGTKARLLEDFTPGVSTELKIDNIDGWVIGQSGSIWNRILTSWDYTNSDGFQWHVQTYTRRAYLDAWPAGAVATPIPGGFSIPSTAAAPGAKFYVDAKNPVTIPAGTYVSHGKAGSTFKYLLGANFKYNENNGDWVRYKNIIGGVDYTGTNSLTNFQPGVAAIRLLVRPLWTNSYVEDEFHLSTWYMHADPSTLSFKKVTTPSTNNSVFREILKRQKLTNETTVGLVTVNQPFLEDTF
jgi:hypothetical protein